MIDLNAFRPAWPPEGATIKLNPRHRKRRGDHETDQSPRLGFGGQTMLTATAGFESWKYKARRPSKKVTHRSEVLAKVLHALGRNRSPTRKPSRQDRKRPAKCGSF